MIVTARQNLRYLRVVRALLLVCVTAGLALPAAAEPSASRFPFFAMDTGTRDAERATFEAQAALLAELGHAGMDHSGTRNVPGKLAALDAHGLELFAMYLTVTIDGGKANTPGLPEAVRALKGRPTIIWLALRSKRHQASSTAGDEEGVAVIRQVADLAKVAGVRVAMYPHTGFWVERVEDAVRLARLAQRDNVGAGFNLCHWLRVTGGEQELAPILAAAMPHLFVVTINGADRAGTSWKTLIQTLDRGTHDTLPLLQLLRDLGYAGPVGLQGFGIGGDVRDNLTRSMVAWRAMSAQLPTSGHSPDAVAARILSSAAVAGVSSYEFGESRAAFMQLEAAFRAYPQPVRLALGDELLKLLPDAAVTLACKREVCRLLGRWGTAENALALAEHLPDTSLSSLVRHALHARPGAGIDQVFIDALPRGPVALRPGIIDTIGVRRINAAVPQLAEFATARDTDAARAAVSALGRIGTPDAADVLASLAVPEPVRPVWRESLLVCAEGLAAGGAKARAGALYEQLLGDEQPGHVRAAALAGLVVTNPQRGLQRVLSVLRDIRVAPTAGETATAIPALRLAAIRQLPRLPGAATAQVTAELLRDGRPAEKVVALAGLTRVVSDPALSSAVVALTASEDPAVSSAAVQALAAVGDASHVALLARLAANDSGVASLAERALTRLRRKGVDTAIGKLLLTTEPSVQALLLRVMAARSPAGTVPALIGLARTAAAAAVQREALKALGKVARGPDLAEVVDLVVAAPAGASPEHLAGVLGSVAARAEQRARRAELLRGLAAAEGLHRIPFLRVLSQFGGARELTAAAALLTDEDMEARRATIRTLASWPDATPIDILRSVSETADDELSRLLALRGIIGMIGRDVRLTTQAKLEQFRDALQAATRPAERKQILAALGSVPEPGVLDVIAPWLADPGLAAEARLAYANGARAAGLRAPSLVSDALRERIAATADAEFRRDLAEALAWIGTFGGHITAWRMAGPYAGASGLFAAEFAPEKEDGTTTVAWRAIDAASGPFTKFIKPGGVNLGALIGGSSRVAYLRCMVDCPTAQDAVLELGSDDGVKAWLNGELVHANDARRAVKAGSDRADVSLRAGPNQLLLKVTQAAGEWGAVARFVTPAGEQISGLVFRPQ